MVGADLENNARGYSLASGANCRVQVKNGGCRVSPILECPFTCAPCPIRVRFFPFTFAYFATSPFRVLFSLRWVCSCIANGVSQRTEFFGLPPGATSEEVAPESHANYYSICGKEGWRNLGGGPSPPDPWPMFPFNVSAYMSVYIDAQAFSASLKRPLNLSALRVCLTH